MRFYTLLLGLIFSLSALSQTTTPDSRLQERFSQQQLSTMDEGRVAYWNYYLDNSFEIMEIVEEKAAYLNDLEEIDIDVISFHGLTINLDNYHQKGAYLKIKGEAKMLVVKPLARIIEEFNTYYQSSKQ